MMTYAIACVLGALAIGHATPSPPSEADQATSSAGPIAPPDQSSTELTSPAEAEPRVEPGYLPEDFFKGQIVITRTRLPAEHPSPAAFLEALRTSRIDVVDRVKRANQMWGKWNIEYLAFFAAPPEAREIWVKFYLLADGRKYYVAGNPQHPQHPVSRSFGASMDLSEPEFRAPRRYQMTVEAGNNVLASTEFWLSQSEGDWRHVQGNEAATAAPAISQESRARILTGGGFGFWAGVGALGPAAATRAGAGGGWGGRLNLGVVFWQHLVVDISAGVLRFDDHKPFTELVRECTTNYGVSLGCGDPQTQSSEITATLLGTEMGYQHRFRLQDRVFAIPAALVGFTWNPGGLKREIIGCEDCRTFPVAGVVARGAYLAPSFRVAISGWLVIGVRSEIYLSGDLAHRSLLGLEVGRP